MKITFVVPALNLTGGLRVVAIYANLLSKKGHTVTVVSPNQNRPDWKQKLKSAFKWKGYNFKPWFNRSYFENAIYDVKVLDKHRPVVSEDLPDADILIATFWNTAEWIADFPDIKGKKVYFIQHYEMHPWLPLERVKATFSLPYQKIVVSHWIANALSSNHNINDVNIVPNGVDTDQFYSHKRCKQKNTTFGIMYSPRAYKGCKDAFLAFEKAKAKNMTLQLVAFGSNEPTHELPLPVGTKFFCLPKQEQLKDIYGCCDAWIFSSITEGFGLPILEAMACRTPVIGTDSGAAEMLIDKSNGFLIKINDIDAMSQAISTVSEMSNKDWQVYSESAYSTAVKHKWSDTVVLFEHILKNHMKV